MFALLAIAAFLTAIVIALRGNDFTPPASARQSSAFGGAYFDLAAATAIMKELVDSGQLVEDETYRDNPAYTLLKKSTDFYGKNYPVPLAYSAAGGGSTTFANAQANQAPAGYAEFQLTRRREYALGTLDNETAEACGDSKGAFVDAVYDVVDKAKNTSINRICSGLFRTGTGSIGKIASGGITSGVITLDDPTSTSQFEVNQVLQADATDGGASPRSALGYVTSVDRIAGTVTVASSGFGGSAASPTSWTAGDFLLVQGDLNTKISGFPAWLLASAPSASDNFYSVNRSTDRWRLAGGYYDGSAIPIEEAFVNGANLLGREGVGPDICFTNFQSYSNLELSLGAKVQYTELMAKGSGDAQIAFEGIKISGPRSKITVIPDRSCPQKVAHMLKMSTWCLKSIGEFPKILTYKDTNTYMRVVNADAMETRVGGYGNLYTNAPGYNEQIALGA